ncbi:MAG TPA: hypothetical protein VNM48_03150 [Chloroflexota bacterium]|nr:hypothetical protein [Chloroflexota bacterium]
MLVAIGIIGTTFVLRGRPGSASVPSEGRSVSTVAAAPVAGQAPERSASAQGNAPQPQSMMMAAAPSEQELAKEAEVATRKFEAIFAADRPEPVEDSKTEQALTRALESRLVQEARSQPLNAQVACRSSMCRIESNFRPGEEASEWSTRLLLEMGRTFGAVTTVFPPGGANQKKVVMYAFRPGHEPPR